MTKGEDLEQVFISMVETKIKSQFFIGVIIIFDKQVLKSEMIVFPQHVTT